MPRERERGTLEALFVTPVRPFEIVLAKLIPYVVVGMIDIVICIAAHILFLKSLCAVHYSQFICFISIFNRFIITWFNYIMALPKVSFQARIKLLFVGKFYASADAFRICF